MLLVEREEYEDIASMLCERGSEVDASYDQIKSEPVLWKRRHGVEPRLFDFFFATVHLSGVAIRRGTQLQSYRLFPWKERFRTKSYNLLFKQSLLS